MKLPRHGKTRIGTIYVGGIFGDGGGFEITPWKDGTLHIYRIPPREPVMVDLQLISTLLSQAEMATSEEIRQKLNGVVENVASALFDASVTVTSGEVEGESH